MYETDDGDSRDLGMRCIERPKKRADYEGQPFSLVALFSLLVQMSEFCSLKSLNVRTITPLVDIAYQSSFCNSLNFRIGNLLYKRLGEQTSMNDLKRTIVVRRYGVCKFSAYYY